MLFNINDLCWDKEILEELLERDEAQIAQLKEHKII